MLWKVTVTVDPAGTVTVLLSNLMFWAVISTDAAPPADVVAVVVAAVVADVVRAVVVAIVVVGIAVVVT